jgi:acetyltransferase
MSTAALPCRLRPVRPDDAGKFERFVMRLSAPSRRMRFHGALSSCPPALLKAMTQPEAGSHRAWVALDPDVDHDAIIGEARFVKTNAGDAELAIAVADEYQGRGLADRLLRTIIDNAMTAQVRALFGDVLEDNARMFGLLRRHGFEVQRSAHTEAGVVRWRLRLSPGSVH